MKNLLLLFSILSVTLFISSCGDPCDDVNCGPGICDDGTCMCPDGFEGTNCEIDLCANVECGPGECDNGTCICPDGYEGDACETETRTLFFGSFQVVDTTCPDGISINIESINILAGTSDITSVIIEHFDGSDISITMGTIIDRTLESSGIDNGFEFFTNGTFSEDGNTLTGELGVVGFATCDMVFER